MTEEISSANAEGKIDPPAEEVSEQIEETTSEETEETANEESEQEEPTSESDEESEVKDEEVSDEEASEAAKVRFSELKKKYPNLLKEHPELRANYFKAEQYAEYFPTVEDAQEAAKKVEIFDNLDAEVSVGNFSSLIEVVGKTNPKALEKVADDILPQLYKANPALYFRASKQVITHALTAAMRRAESTKDDNLKASVQNIANFVFGSASVPSNQQQQQANDPEKEALRNQLNQTLSNTALGYQNDVYVETENVFRNEIKKGLDPKNELNEAMKSYVEDKVIEDITGHLERDRKFQAEIQSLWQRAMKSGFPVELKAKIRNAYLARARTLLPAIRQKRRAEALGTNPKPANGKTNIPASAGTPKGSSQKLTKEIIREKHMSPMDIIMHGVK